MGQKRRLPGRRWVADPAMLVRAAAAIELIAKGAISPEDGLAAAVWPTHPFLTGEGEEIAAALELWQVAA